MDNLISNILRFRWFVVIAFFALVAAAGMQIIKLKPVTGYKVFFNHDYPQLLEFESIENKYTKTDVLMVAVESKNGTIFDRETLSAVEWITDQAMLLPYAKRADSITNHQHTDADGDDLYIDDLFRESDSLSDEELQRRKNIALSKSILVNRLINPEGTVTAIVLTINFPADEKENALPHIVNASRGFKSQIEGKFPFLDVHLSGNVIMNYAFTEAGEYDFMHLVPITLGLIVLGIYLFTRTVSGTVASTLVIIGAIAIGMGAAGILGLYKTPPLFNAPIMILTLAVADCIHLIMTFNHQYRITHNKRESIIYSFHLNFMPVMLTSLTTAVGFLTLNFSDAPPFRDLGNVVAVGVIAAFAFSILVLPAFLMILPIKEKHGQSTESKWMEGFADWVISKRKILFPVSSLTMLGLIAFLPMNELNDVWSEYFDEALDARVSADYVRDNLTGLNTIQYSLNSGEESGINNPEYLQNIEGFANWFRSQEETLHVFVYTDIIKELNQNMNYGDEAFYKIPESRELAAQYLLLYEMSLPQGLDLNNQINVKKSSTRMIVTLNNVSTAKLLEIEERALTWLKTNTPDYMHNTGSSSDVMFAHLGQTNIRSMLLGTSIALLIISIILIFALKSIKYGLLSLIPNVAPAAVGFGIWGLVDGQIGLGISIVAGVTLGIVVDDTIHFLSKYLRAKRQDNLNGKEAVRYSFHTVGVALTATTVILCLGFSVLAFSTFDLNAQMGLLTAITIAVALLIDFLFLPSLLMRVDKKHDLALNKEVVSNA